MQYFIAWQTDFAALLFVFAGTRYLAEQNASPLLPGALGASFFLLAVVNNGISSRIADRVGRGRVALCGTALSFASLAGVAGLSPENCWFLAAYTFVGVSIGFIYPRIMAWIGHGKSGRYASGAYLWFVWPSTWVCFHRSARAAGCSRSLD